MAEVAEKPIIMQPESVLGILAGRKTQTRRLVDEKRLRVRLPYEVRSDLADIMPGTAIVAKPGIYKAGSNLQGAMSVRVDGKMLGVKPGEFDFVCPYVTGTARLVNGKWCIEPHGAQRLWVRETFAVMNDQETTVYLKDAPGAVGTKIVYRADKMEPGDGFAWRSPIFMPRRASRLTLEVTDVRIERLHDITEEDALDEGVHPEFEVDIGRFLRADECVEHRTYRLGYKHVWDRLNEKRAPWSSNPLVWAITFRRAA